jgi:hypothetical protein
MNECIRRRESALFEGSDRTINEIMTLYFADRLKDGKSVERAAAMAGKSSSGFGERKPEDINMPFPVDGEERALAHGYAWERSERGTGARPSFTS